MNYELRTRILAALANVDSRDAHRSTDAQVWFLKDPRLLAAGKIRRSRAVFQCKTDLLKTFASSGSAFILHPDDPDDYGVTGHWPLVGWRTYRMPAELDPEESGPDEWFFTLGNWLAYVAPSPVTEGWPDPFETKPPDLVDWMAHAGLDALIASFPDDTEWVVALSDGLAA